MGVEEQFILGEEQIFHVLKTLAVSPSTSRHGMLRYRVQSLYLGPLSRLEIPLPPPIGSLELILISHGSWALPWPVLGEGEVGANVLL